MPWLSVIIITFFFTTCNLLFNCFSANNTFNAKDPIDVVMNYLRWRKRIYVSLMRMSQNLKDHTEENNLLSRHRFYGFLRSFSSSLYQLHIGMMILRNRLIDLKLR